MKTVYIAHPLAGDGSPEWGDEERNVYRYLCFIAWAMEQGYAVISWVHHTLLYERGLKKDFAYWLDRDTALLRLADEVWLCGPVAVSRGMQVEEQVARKHFLSTAIRHDPEWDDPIWYPPSPKIDNLSKIDREALEELRKLRGALLMGTWKP